MGLIRATLKYAYKSSLKKTIIGIHTSVLIPSIITAFKNSSLCKVFKIPRLSKHYEKEHEHSSVQLQKLDHFDADTYLLRQIREMNSRIGTVVNQLEN